MKRVHVEIGLQSYDAPVIQEWPDDPLWKDYIKVQKDANTTALMHKRWVRFLDDEALVSAPSTDWHSFLTSHWDQEHNHLQTDYLEEFYQLYRSCHNSKSNVGAAPKVSPAPVVAPAPTACTPSPAKPQQRNTKKAAKQQPQQLEFSFDW